MPGIINSNCLNPSPSSLQNQLKLKPHSLQAFHTAKKEMQPECCCLSVRLSSHINKTELHLAKHCPTWFSMCMHHQVITILLIYSFYKSAKLLLSCQFRLFPLKLKDPWLKIMGVLTLHFPTHFDSGSPLFFFLMHLKPFYSQWMISEDTVQYQNLPRYK